MPETTPNNPIQEEVPQCGKETKDTTVHEPVNQDSVAPAAALPPTAETRIHAPVWGGAKPVASVGKKKPPSLAEIMAQENEDKLAAQAAYNSTVAALVDIEAEQQEILQALQASERETNNYDTRTQADNQKMSEEEMLEIVMKQSLADYESSTVMDEMKKPSAEQPNDKIPAQTPSFKDSGNSDIEISESKPATKSQHTSSAAVEAPSPMGTAAVATSHAAAAAKPPDNFISEEEAAAIESALREADAKEEQESLLLALQLQAEESRRQGQSAPGRRQDQGHVRVVTRAELELQAHHAASAMGEEAGGMRQTQQQQHYFDALAVAGSNRDPGLRSEEEYEVDAAGFRMNSGSAHQWARRDHNTIVGPNNEIRTKHDVQVQGQANAEWLGIEEDDFGLRAHVGNQAFNSFRKNMKRTTKGVATHGTGRAGSDAESTKGKAMDPHVRLQISKAINADLLEHCNGAVKQGKEAIVYHAEQGSASQGFDVAVKVFKRITEFRGRGEYVDGDPRYSGRSFRKATEREQLELWTEKEFRNLVRANRAKVPVPFPLHYKENIIFMRFLGTNGWPAPQIREIDMRKGSKKWDVLYTQVMEAMRRLYVGARLVHGDLSEYNILVAPVLQVDNPIIGEAAATASDLQPVFIDFGQAVDTRHPHAMEYLHRDIDRVQSFFQRNGCAHILTMEEALEFVTKEIDGENSNDDIDETDETPENSHDTTTKAYAVTELPPIAEVANST